MPVTIKSILRVISVIGFFAIMGTVSANIDVSKFKSPKEYKGKVISLARTTVKMGLDYGNYKGNVTYVVPAGTLFFGPILDNNGKIIKPGTVLAKMETGVCEALLSQAKGILENQESMFNRYKYILKKGGKGAVSPQAMLEYKNTYLSAKSQVLLAQARLDTCTYTAQFDGIVDSVMFPGGYTTESDRDIMNVSQLVPIGVQIDMSREEAFKYGLQTPIAIYPLGHDKAIGPYRGGGSVINNKDKDTLTFIVSNSKDEPETKKLKNGTVVPIVRNICPVVVFSVNDRNKSLSVYEESILKDDKGSYVMQVEGQNCTHPINPVFKLKKTYITSANEVSPIESSINYIKLKDTGGLKVNDTVLTAKAAKDLKDGDVVYFEKSRYLFLPGDPVKVVIDTAITNEEVGLQPGYY